MGKTLDAVASSGSYHPYQPEPEKEKTQTHHKK